MATLGVIGYGLVSAVFLLVTIIMLISWRGTTLSRPLLLATLTTAVWGGVLCLDSTSSTFSLRWLLLADLVLMVSWLFFVCSLLARSKIMEFSKAKLVGASASVLVFSALLLTGPNLNEGIETPTELSTLISFGLLAVAFAGLFFLEQLYRNSHSSQRWSLKFLCLAVALVFVYDLFLYSLAMLYKHVDPGAWYARGLVVALAAPMLLVAVKRNPLWSFEFFVSRQAVVYSASVVVVGVYLTLMALGGYYIRLYGGSWASAAQIIFWFTSGLGLVLLLFSGSLRARLRVFVGKHFYRNKYDYREVWIRFARALATPAEGSTIHDRIILAVAETVDSSAGALWLPNESGDYVNAAAWNLEIEPDAVFEKGSDLLIFFENSDWVIDTLEFKQNPAVYQDLTLSPWIDRLTSGESLILPLYASGQLLAILVLVRPLQFSLSWEDTDLLKTVSLQAAGHIAEDSAQQKLAESRQFDAFNRLASFIMHDLKNLIAQQMLVVNNAAKHKHNPEFVDDMISTVENSVQRMNHLLTQLRPEQFSQKRNTVSVGETIRSALAELRGSPQAEFELVSDGAVTVEPHRLGMIVSHIVRNAQDATPADGRVAVSVERKNGHVEINVKDNGAGMDVSFVRQHLFKPFATTKGSKGMGIGAYQVREFAKAAGGDVSVESAVGQGTTFVVRLPIASHKTNETQHGLP